MKYKKQKALIYENQIVKTALENQQFKILWVVDPENCLPGFF
jgi:hypothetical protein